VDSGSLGGLTILFMLARVLVQLRVTTRVRVRPYTEKCINSIHGE